MCLQILGHLGGVVQDKEGVLLEPGNLAPNYATARQGDIAMVASSFTMTHAAADNTVVPTPPMAPTPQQQEAATAVLHTSKEVGKWMGTSCPTGTPAQQAALGAKTVPVHLIVKDMLRHGTVLFLITIDPWMQEGPVAEMLKYGHKLKRSAMT